MSIGEFSSVLELQHHLIKVVDIVKQIMGAIVGLKETTITA